MLTKIAKPLNNDFFSYTGAKKTIPVAIRHVVRKTYINILIKHTLKNLNKKKIVKLLHRTNEKARERKKKKM